MGQKCAFVGRDNDCILRTLLSQNYRRPSFRLSNPANHGWPHKDATGITCSAMTRPSTLSSSNFHRNRMTSFAKSRLFANASNREFRLTQRCSLAERSTAVHRECLPAGVYSSSVLEDTILPPLDANEMKASPSSPHRLDLTIYPSPLLKQSSVHTYREKNEREAELEAGSHRTNLNMFATSQIKKRMHAAKLHAARKARFLLHPHVRVTPEGLHAKEAVT